MPSDAHNCTDAKSHSFTTFVSKIQVCTLTATNFRGKGEVGMSLQKHLIIMKI